METIAYNYRVELACNVIDDLLDMCHVTGRVTGGGGNGRSITATVQITGSMRHVPDFADLLGRESVRLNGDHSLLVDFPLLEETPCPEPSLL